MRGLRGLPSSSDWGRQGPSGWGAGGSSPEPPENQFVSQKKICIDLTQAFSAVGLRKHYFSANHGIRGGREGLGGAGSRDDSALRLDLLLLKFSPHEHKY